MVLSLFFENFSFLSISGRRFYRILFVLFVLKVLRRSCGIVEANSNLWKHLQQKQISLVFFMIPRSLVQHQGIDPWMRKSTHVMRLRCMHCSFLDLFGHTYIYPLQDTRGLTLEGGRSSHMMHCTAATTSRLTSELGQMLLTVFQKHPIINLMAGIKAYFTAAGSVWETDLWLRARRALQKDFQSHDDKLLTWVETGHKVATSSHQPLLTSLFMSSNLGAAPDEPVPLDSLLLHNVLQPYNRCVRGRLSTRRGKRYVSSRAIEGALASIFLLLFSEISSRTERLPQKVGRSFEVEVGEDSHGRGFDLPLIFLKRPLTS